MVLMKRAEVRAFLLLLSPFWVVALTAQQAESEPDGIRVRNISAFSTWYSTAVPAGVPSLGSGLSALGSDVANGGAFLIDARRTRPVVEAWFSYSGSYLAMRKYAESHAYSQFLSGGVSWRLKPRWRLSIAVVGADTTALETLLNPGTAAAFRATPVTMEDLAAAASAGIGADSRVAAYITGSPFAASPTQLLLFGSRIWTVSLNTMLTWSKSSRLSFYLAGVSAGAQHATRRQGDPANTYPSPRSVGVSGGLGFKYQLTRRSEMSLNANVARVHSRTEDAYVSTVTAALGRRMSARWFVYGGIGASSYSGRGAVVPVSRDPGVTGSAQIGYQRTAHTFTIGYNRTLSDTYGFGIGRQSSTTGSWVWQRARWSVFASAGNQQIESVGFAALRGWHASTGVSRFLTSNLSLQIQHAYLRTSGSVQGVRDAADLHSARISLNWTPDIRVRNPTHLP